MAIRHRPNRAKPWRVEVVSKGERLQAAFPTKTEAELWRAQVKAALAAGEAPPPSYAPIPVEEAAEPTASMTVREAMVMVGTDIRAGVIRTRRGTVYRPASIRDIEQVCRLHIDPILGAIPVDTVDRMAVMRMREKLTREKSQAIAAGAVRVLSTVFRRLVSLGIVANNPCRNLDPWVVERDPQRWLTTDEAALLQSAADHHRHERLGTWVALALGTAARRGEIEAATWGTDSIDTTAGTWTIDKSRVQSTGEIGPTKTGKARRIELAPTLLTRLRAYRMAQGRPGDSEPVVGPLPWSGWREVRPVLGEPLLKVKDIRNTVLSWALSGGASVVAVAEYAGHDPKVLLDTYARVMPNDSGTVAAAIDPGLRPNYAQEGSALR